MKTSGIYKIESKIKSNKCYIGSAVCISNRWYIHLRLLRLNKHPNRKLQSHFNKYSESDFQFSILLICEREDLIKNEQYYIDLYKPFFNNCKIAGSQLGIKRTDEFKNKLRGRHISEETIKRLSESHKNKVFSKETREKMSKAQVGNKNVLGSKRSEETKAKLRKSKIGNKNAVKKKEIL
jgi:group I intron endonuclease